MVSIPTRERSFTSQTRHVISIAHMISQTFTYVQKVINLYNTLQKLTPYI